MRVLQESKLVVAAACLLTLAACRSAAPIDSTPLAASDYAAAFEATKTELRRLGFVLGRIDARAGVIETQPKSTAGLATPWDREQTSLVQEWRDFTSPHQRIIRVVFTPTDADPAANTPLPDPDLIDLRDHAGPIDLSVTASIYRLRIPHQRIETESVRLSSRAFNPERPRLSSPHLTPIGRDQPLSDAIATRIRAAVSPSDS